MNCPQCDIALTLHQPGSRGICHGCGLVTRVPADCPECRSPGLVQRGTGTQRLEEQVRRAFPDAAVARMDTDTMRSRGSHERTLDAFRDRQIDILVGTQMLAKGHDFRRLSVVAVLDVDAALYSSDFRAPERLFALLMQVSGRAGRSAQGARVIVQTRFPGHPVFAALGRHDYDGFADAQLAERRDARLPPFVFLALLRAEAKTLEVALEFLERAAEMGRETAKVAGAAAGGPGEPEDLGRNAGVIVYDPVPMLMMRVAGRERAQLLVESASRKALHAFIDAWLARLGEEKTPVRWQLEVDPLEI